MKAHFVRRTGMAGALVALLAVAACGDANVIGPDNQPEIANALNTFQFQVSALVNVTQELSYDWQNEGIQATVDVSQAITSGSALLTILDSQGAVMYQEDIADGISKSTIAGSPGAWKITVSLQGVHGTFNFRSQRLN
ncbi:MAG: hypothetical protein OEZ65_13905 [Gemmatimonadota bacterium]|nr:hypothetical protein [Gemmatimonadota bacterium]MDH5760678.1 hypothetical protein [Gemmatimonadota bacterium]